MNLIDKVRMEDLDGDQREMAELVGMESYIRLIKRCGGTYVYIPKRDSVERKIRDKEIREDFNGGNYKELALQYSLTEITIRNIIDGTGEDLKKGPVDGQTSFF